MKETVLQKIRDLAVLAEKNAWEEQLSFCLSLKSYAGKDRMLDKMLKLIVDGYPRMDAKTQHLSCLISICLYELFSRGRGRMAVAACANLLPDLEKIEGLNWNETVCNYLSKKTLLQNAQSLNNNLSVGMGNDMSILYTPYIGTACCMEMDVKEKIVCYREPEGALILLGLNNFSGDILCDETVVYGEPPLYFTAETHFVSPLYKLQKMRDILKEVLRQRNYPYVRIKLKVVYTSMDASLINADDLQTYWVNEDVENLLIKKHFDIFPLKRTASASTAFPDMLRQSLATTRAAYAIIPMEKVYDLRQIRKAIKKVNSSYG